MIKDLDDEEFYEEFGICREDAQEIINEINKPIWWDYIHR